MLLFYFISLKFIWINSVLKNYDWLFDLGTFLSDKLINLYGEKKTNEYHYNNTIIERIY